MSTYEHSHQEVVKIEMNSISVPTVMNKNTDIAVMELMIGNMNLRISNETDAIDIAYCKSAAVIKEYICDSLHIQENIIDVKQNGKVVILQKM